MALPKIYNWERIRAALKLLSEAFPDEFQNWVLIGGGASWFFREQLKNANDPDFRVPVYSADEETIWLSKDVDFMGLTEAEGAALLGSPFKPETHTISFRGLEVDFLEEGFRLTLELALRNPREVRTSDFVFYVVDPSVLYSEKSALVASKSRPQDRLHRSLLAEFLKYELCTDVEQPAELSARDWVARAKTIKTADLEFFARDEKFARRLALGIAKLPPLHKPLKHWAKHHLPGYTD